jgi:hypothetical protein
MRWGRLHKGVDITNSPIYAVADGMVTESGSGRIRLGVEIFFLVVWIIVWVWRERQAKNHLQIKQVCFTNSTSFPIKPKKAEDFIKDLCIQNRGWYKRLMRGHEWF